MSSLSMSVRAVARKLLPMSARWALIEYVGAMPRLYFPLARILKYDRVVNEDTTLVIEGYPRSSNSFARWAFELAQPHKTNIAHHRHVPSQVIRGVELGKPVLVLIREPQATCISHAIFLRDQVSMSQIMRAYCTFYQTALPFREFGKGFEVALFEQVTSDFGQVIMRLNHRFGTRFTPFDHTPENVERCFKLEEEHYRRRHGEVDERGVARPSDLRAQERERQREAFQSPALAGLRQEAQSSFAAYEALATNTG